MQLRFIYFCFRRSDSTTIRYLQVVLWSFQLYAGVCAGLICRLPLPSVLIPPSLLTPFRASRSGVDRCGLCRSLSFRLVSNLVWLLVVFVPLISLLALLPLNPRSGSRRSPPLLRPSRTSAATPSLRTSLVRHVLFSFAADTAPCISKKCLEYGSGPS